MFFEIGLHNLPGLADLSIGRQWARPDPVRGGVRGADEQRPGRGRPPMTLEQLEAFYAIEYPKLVKILVLLDATIEEAEDAAQKAMTDFAKRSKTTWAPDHPASYVRRAAVNFFI